jgi:membrane protein
MLGVLRKWTQAILDWLARVITEPRSELTRWQRTARFTYDLGRYGARQLHQDRAGQMAAALSFRTLFGLIPVLLVGTVLVRALQGSEEWLARVEEFINREFGWDKIKVSDNAGAAAAEVGGNSTHTLTEWLVNLMGHIENINFTAVGWIGLAVVAYSAIGLMVTIENSFNVIYRAPEGRTWARRLPIYWFVLTLGPLVLVGTFLLSARLGGWMESRDAWLGIMKVAAFLCSFITIWLVMLIIYKLVPNTNVAIRPALIGSGVAALLIEIGQRTLGIYFANAVSFTQLLGSLGLVPVFMFWVYLMWLIVLFGLELSTTLQMLGGRRLDEMERARQSLGLVDPAAVVTVMEAVARRFEEAHPVTSRQIADDTLLAESTVQPLLERLAEAGFIHRLDREDGAVSLARPPDKITADELIELGYKIVDEGVGEQSSFLKRLREVQRTIAAESTLAMLAAQRQTQPVQDVS